MSFQRIFVIVIDSLGSGDMADSAAYGDVGVNTLLHISEEREKFSIPNLAKLGIGNLVRMKQVEAVEEPIGYSMRMNEKSRGKDTMTGHWELMGLYTTKPFQTFTEHGFPKELIEELENC